MISFKLFMKQYLFSKKMSRPVSINLPKDIKSKPLRNYQNRIQCDITKTISNIKSQKG